MQPGYVGTEGHNINPCAIKHKDHNIYMPKNISVEIYRYLHVCTCFKIKKKSNVVPVLNQLSATP
jgi:hypothetical protein